MGSYFGRKTGISAFVVLVAVTANYYRNIKTLSPIVEISTGKLQGVVSYTRAGKEVHEYLKIPFAAPPEGDLRYEPPQPVQPWQGIYDATETGPQCIQVNLLKGNVEGAEDCLHLNVYTPAKRDRLLPVMLWIHGGAFVFGTGSRYKPAYLLDSDVILVTVNYRLASMGFLNTGDGTVRGNMGLRDQNFAMKWVQENIAVFGGDKDQVTIFGESAGSASVGFHLLSPLSKGLFKRAIMQSGSPLGNWAVTTEPYKQAVRYAEKLNCSRPTTKEMVSCLKKLDAFTVVSVHKEILLPLREKITLFVPSIEAVKDENTFLAEQPLELLKSGRVNKAPLIIGVNQDEGLLSSAIITANKTKLQQANDRWDYFAPRVFGYDTDRKDISDKVRQYYFGSIEDIGSIDYITNYTNIYSDRQFFAPVQKFVKQYSKLAPTRLYLYSYSAEFSLADVLAASQNERLPAIVSVILELLKRWAYRQVGHGLPHLGVCHGDELQLIFNWPLSSYITPDHEDVLMSKVIVQTWTDFAKGSSQVSVNGVNWPVVDIKTSTAPLQYLEINETPKMIDEPFSERIKFWDSLGI